MEPLRPVVAPRVSTTVKVDLGNRSYPIYIGSGLFDEPDLLQRFDGMSQNLLLLILFNLNFYHLERNTLLDAVLRFCISVDKHISTECTDQVSELLQQKDRDFHPYCSNREKATSRFSANQLGLTVDSGAF